MQTPSGYPPADPRFDPRIVPPPPRLHWGWVLGLSILTRGLFNSIWLVVQANWIRKMTGRQDVLTWAIVNIAAIPFIFFGAVMAGLAIALVPGLHLDQHGTQDAVWAFTGVIMLLVVGLYAITVFRMRDALESAAIGIPLGGVMTFLFSAIYFQYFLHDYVLMTPEEMWGRLPDPPAYVPPTSQEPSL